MNTNIKLSETKIMKLKDNILEFMFCDPIPTFAQLQENKKIEPFQLCEEYEDFCFDSLMSKIDSNVCEFNSHFNVVTAPEDNLLYGVRAAAEFGTDEDIIISLYNIDNLTTQSFVDNEDIISLEILPCEIEDEDFEMIREELINDLTDSVEESDIELLINVLKQAKENNVPTLYLYND